MRITARTGVIMEYMPVKDAERTKEQAVKETPLDRYAAENEPDDRQIVKLCVGLADILIYLHGRTPPVIHRDIKP